MQNVGQMLSDAPVQFDPDNLGDPAHVDVMRQE